MKKVLGLLVFIFQISYVLSQGSETFTNLNAPAGAYGNGSYVGDGGVTWTYNQARTVTATDNITGTSIGFRDTGTRNVSASSGASGVGTVTYSTRSYFTGGTAANRTIELWVNGTQYDSFTLGAMSTVYTRNIVVNVSGNVTIEFRATGTRQIVLDNVSWTAATAACTPPTTQATSFSSSGISFTNGTASWVRGNGNNVLVIARPSVAPTAPTSGTNYTANAVYGSGSAVGGGFAVYNGTGTSVNVTGLTSGVTYHFAIYEYANTGVCYLSPALTGTFTTMAVSTTSDIISAGGESVTIPSSNILAGPLTSTQGLQVWRITVRDGGGASDADNLPTILTSFTITQNAGNAMNDWAVAIQSVDIFDGATHLATGVVTATTITFSGLSITAPDNGSKTISMRLSLNCPATGNGNVNGDDFVFTITNANATEAVSGSSNFASFTAASSTNGQNAFTELTTTITSISPTSGPANTLVTINATGGGFTGATAVAFNGISAASFTIISNTQIQAVVPVGATTGNITVTDVNCYQAAFSTFTVISNFISGCEGSSIFNDLIISEVTDATSGSLTYIEIYNGTGAVVNLANYTLIQRTNGGIDATINLVGTLANNDTYVVRVGSTASACAAGDLPNGYPTEDQTENGVSGINNNDCFILQKFGVDLDVWGECDGSVWVIAGAAGYDYIRDPSIINPNTTYTPSEWIITDWTTCFNSDYSTIGSHSAGSSNSPSITTHPTTTTLCSSESTSLTVAGTEGFVGGLGLAYQWFVSAPGAASWTALTNAGVYSGVTTAVLSISSVAGLDGYQYYCQIRENTATCYSASNAVQLDVLGTGGTNGLWTGAFSTDWCNCRNWDDGQVPTNITNVVINQTAVNNCVVGGSCTNGVANSVSVSSSTNTNNLLTINAGSNLTITNNLTISKSAGTGSLVVSTTGTGQLVVNGSVTITGSGGTDNAFLRNESATALLDVNGSLTISTRGALDLNANGRLNLAGDFVNNNSEAAFDQATSTVIFDGTTNQSINTNAFTDVFATLTVNKASGTLTLLDPIEIVTQVNFTSGIIISSATNLLIFRAGSNHTTTSDNSHTNGPVRKIGNTAFTFPVGNGTFYRNIAISAPSVISDHFTAQFFDVSPDAVDGVAVANIEVPLTNISDCEHWILDRTNGNSNVFVTLSYRPYGANGCSGVTDPVSLKVARWDVVAQIWRNHGGTGTGPTTGTITTAAPVTAFSPFALSTTHLNNPLPAELIHFDAVPVNKEVSVTWSTASEINVDYFEVMRSQDGVEFNTIATVDAVGNSSVLNQYATIDSHPYIGLSYYQLNTVDEDGSSKLSDIKPVYFDGMSATPYISTTVTNWTIYYTSPSEEPVLIEIFDASGKLVQTERIQFSDAYGSVEHFNLSKGMYFIRIVDGEHSFTLKALR